LKRVRLCLIRVFDVPFEHSAGMFRKEYPMIPTLNVETLTYEQLAKTIDHSLLRPELTDEDVVAGCELARRYNVASVCVKPCHVVLAARLLADSDVKVGTVVGFPHGNSTTATKVFEDQDALANGAEELDLERGLTLFLPNLAGTWPNVPLKATIGAAVKLPTHLLNDVRCFTLCE
jgi:hypothetical protein